ncbi:MAG: response regulator [Planctomycetota bacterium]
MGTHAILVVDDDRLVRESLCEMLGDLDQRVEAAANGDVALRYLQANSYELVFSDIDMPSISGFELIERMRVLQYRPQVVLMSARSDERLQAAAERAGALALLGKPVGMHQLTGMLNSLWPTTIFSQHTDIQEGSGTHG